MPAGSHAHRVNVDRRPELLLTSRTTSGLGLAEPTGEGCHQLLGDSLGSLGQVGTRGVDGLHVLRLWVDDRVAVARAVAVLIAARLLQPGETYAETPLPRRAGRGRDGAGESDQVVDALIQRGCRGSAGAVRVDEAREVDDVTGASRVLDDHALEGVGVLTGGIALS